MSTTPTRMNSEQLTRAIARESGLTASAARRFLSVFRDVVTCQLAAGNSVAVTNFGTWLPNERPTRNARNPQTGETVSVEGFTAVKWRTSPRMADIVRAHDTTATTHKHSSRPQPAAPSEQQDA